MTVARGPRPLPDADSVQWWQGLADHQLLLQRCDRCDRARWPSRAICGECGSLEWRWVPSGARGTVASWIVNHHGFAAGAGSPYTVVLVRLAEQDDLLIPGGWGGAADGSDVWTGRSVVAGYEHLAPEGDEPEIALLRWEPA